MKQSIARELATFMTSDEILSWLKLFKDKKVSRNFINEFINIAQKTSTEGMSRFIPEIREALQEGISEEAIIWLYNPDVNFNKFYSKEILSKGQTLGEEPTKTYWNLRLNDNQRKKLKEAFKSGLTVLQVSLIAKSKFHESEMDELIKYLKLGIGLEIDFNMSYLNIIREMKKEASEKLEHILLNI